MDHLCVSLLYASPRSSMSFPVCLYAFTIPLLLQYADTLTL